MPHSLKKHSRAYVLLPVVLTLVIVAAVAFMLTQEGAFNAGSVVRGQETSTALYAAEAGLKHATWKLNRLNCSGYTDISGTSLGAHSYTASITDSSGATLTSGSPANISVTGTHANGGSYSLQRNGVKIYQFPTQQLLLQPDATAGKDTYLYEWKSTWNYGLSADFWVDNVYAYSIARSLLQFDLSTLPENVVIQSATLELYQNSPSAKGGDVSVHRVTGAWEEGIKSGGIGAANWTQSATGINWTTAGGDYDATAITTTSLPAGSVGWFQWDIKSLIQGWADASYPNQGVALIPSTPNTSAYFYSSDHTNPLQRPKLSITYACECGVVCASAELPHIFLSTPADASLGGLTFTSNDIVEYDSMVDIATLLFDGSNIGFNAKINAFHLLQNGHLLISLSSANSIGGLALGPEDLGEYDPVNNTASLVFDGSVLLQGGNNSISSIFVKADGKLILSSSTASTLGGQAFQPEDLLEYDPVTDTANLYLDGSAIGLVQPISSVHLLDNGHIVLSFNNNETIGGLAVTDGDLVDYDPATNTASLYFDGLARFGTAQRIASVHIGAGSGSLGPPVQQGYLDQFNSMSCNAAVDYIGSDGSLDWTTFAWEERAESDGPCAGLTQIGDDPVVPEAGSYRLIFKEKLSGAARSVDLSTVANATLSFDYRRDNYPTTSDHFIIEIDDGIGSGWVELDSISGIANDPAYLSASYDISAFATASTRIRFRTEGVNTIQTLYLDNIKISDEAAAPAAPSNFGFETIFDQTQSAVRRKQIATQVNLSEDGTLNSITAHIGGTTFNARFAIYTDVSGEPGVLLAETANFSTDTAMSWITALVPDTALTAGDYWLALSFDHNSQIYTYQTGGQTRYNNTRATQFGFDSNWGTSTASYSRSISIYATYTPQ